MAINNEEIYNYYTIIGSEDKINYNNGEEQVVFLTLNEEQSNPEEPLLNADLLNDNIIEYNSNVKIIKLEDGSMLMTTGEDENFETIEPHLISDEPEGNSLTLDVKDDTETDFELVEVNALPEDDSEINVFYYNVEENDTIKKISTEKRFVCLYEDCDKSYGTSHHLSVHMRNHLDKKPFECPVEDCDKNFSTNYSLKAHMRTHTGEKPYGCMFCSKQFRAAGDLQKHMRIHTGERPFVCPIVGCGKSFTTSNIRKVHIRSHTGERPYTCPQPNCGKAFSSATNYKNHLRIHSGEKPYVCNVPSCNKRFTEYSSLYKHNMAHQTKRPFECNFEGCTQKFKQESALNLHKRVKHKIIMTKDGTEIVVDVS